MNRRKGKLKDLSKKITKMIIILFVIVLMVTIIVKNDTNNENITGKNIFYLAKDNSDKMTIIASPPITTERAKKVKEKEEKEKSGKGTMFSEMYLGEKKETSFPKGNNKWNVPLMMQNGITLPFGSGTVSTHGCGPAVCAMILSTMNKQNVSIEELATRYINYSNSNGSDIGLLKVAAFELSKGTIEVEETTDRKVMLENLEKGNLVAALVKNSKWAPDYIHWVVYRDTTDKGEVYINDPTSVVNTNNGPYNLDEYEGQVIKYAIFVNKKK